MGQLWNAKMDFKESAMAEVRQIESSYNNFFIGVKALINEANANPSKSDGVHHYHAAERALMEK